MQLYLFLMTDIQLKLFFCLIISLAAEWFEKSFSSDTKNKNPNSVTKRKEERKDWTSLLILLWCGVGTFPNTAQVPGSTQECSSHVPPSVWTSVTSASPSPQGGLFARESKGTAVSSVTWASSIRTSSSMMQLHEGWPRSFLHTPYHEGLSNVSWYHIRKSWIPWASTKKKEK